MWLADIAAMATPTAEASERDELAEDFNGWHDMVSSFPKELRRRNIVQTGITIN
jgi:hypothetical protein